MDASSARMYQSPQVMHQQRNMTNPEWGPGASAYYPDNRQQGNNYHAKPHYNANRRPQQKHQSSPPPSPQWQPQGYGKGNTTSPSPQGGPLDANDPVAVKLEGLPRALCRQNFLEAILEQAGLTENILSCVLGQEQEMGKALIYLTHPSAAQMCMDHFRGCCWDKSGTPVTAYILDMPSENRQRLPTPPPPPINNRAEKAGPGGKTRKSRDARSTMSMDEPFMNQMPIMPPQNDLSGMMMPAPALPIAMVSKAPWDNSYPQNGLPIHEYNSRNSNISNDSTGSTQAGDNTHLSMDSELHDNFLGCDTDDGF